MWKYTSDAFYLMNGGTDNRVYFVNRKESNHAIFFNEDKGSWDLVDWQDENDFELIASTQSSLASLALGSNEWVIFNDSKDCFKGESESYVRTLTFSVCTADEFTCRDGNCVPMTRRCDGKFECRDKTDEKDCFLIVEDPSYSKGISPPPPKKLNFTDIHISVNLIEILKIDEIEKIFEVKFKLFCTWVDSRLTYENLKKNPNLNVLQLEDQKSIWTPSIIFSNTKESDQSKIDEKSSIRVLPDKNFAYTKSLKTAYKNSQYFEGAKNILEMSRMYRIDFLCTYNMALYPFDTQTCSLKFEQSEV